VCSGEAHPKGASDLAAANLRRPKATARLRANAETAFALWLWICSTGGRKPNGDLTRAMAGFHKLTSRGAKKTWLGTNSQGQPRLAFGYGAAHWQRRHTAHWQFQFLSAGKRTRIIKNARAPTDRSTHLGGRLELSCQRAAYSTDVDGGCRPRWRSTIYGTQRASVLLRPRVAGGGPPIWRSGGKPHENCRRRQQRFTAGTSSKKPSVGSRFVCYCNCAGLLQVQPCSHAIWPILLGAFNLHQSFNTSRPPLSGDQEGALTGSHYSTLSL